MSAPTPGGALGQVERLLTLVPWLHARGEVRVDEAADTLGVDPRQLVRDLKVLLMCGLPGGYPGDLIDVDLDAIEGPDAEGVIRVTNADYLTRPLRLKPTEATALIVALRAVRSSGGPDTAAVVDRALAKLEAAAAEGGATAQQVEVAIEDADLAGLRGQLTDAVTRERQVRLTYYVPARDEESVRVVDPLSVVSSGAHSYLDAWCHSAEAPRLFRLDRIHGAEVLDSPIQARPAAARDLSAGLFEPSESSLRVTMRLAPPAFWVPEYYPVEDVREGPDGSLEVDLLASDERWMQRLLLRLAPHATVVGPRALAERHALSVERTLRLYG
ncbi:YafY family protein [Nocardioides sp.]|uniref:helix-turn-helix transcriptional regulator n=1 Tax=Nocardioides sp. TaxID=35761 RepID=UPI002733B505|nr:WYL domain-containing protein [Nocardioides sp.]MDP3889685.1 WYL domain-containing protein [Nocardioides sp.]